MTNECDYHKKYGQCAKCGGSLTSSHKCPAWISKDHIGESNEMIGVQKECKGGDEVSEVIELIIDSNSFILDSGNHIPKERKEKLIQALTAFIKSGWVEKEKYDDEMATVGVCIADYRKETERLKAENERLEKLCKDLIGPDCVPLKRSDFV